MTIKECFNTRDFDVEVDEVKRVSAVNVGFLTNDGKEDEAQLNVHQNNLSIFQRNLIPPEIMYSIALL